MRLPLRTYLLLYLVVILSACTNTQRETPTSERSIMIESDGWILTGRLLAEPSREPRPIALLLHKASGTSAEYQQLQSALLDRGIASLAIDLRGHGESTNLGSFDPEDRTTRAILDGTERDVIAVHKWIHESAMFDPDRVAVVGASYSAERAAEAGRDYKYGAAYVQLSPGSITDLTIESIDGTSLPWLFIRGEIEFSFFDEIFDLIEEKSQSAEIWIEPGRGHATDLLALHPDLNERLADWISARLR